MSSSEAGEYRSRARAWFQANTPRDWRTRTDRVEFDRWWLRKLHEAGYLVPRWPREYGGEDLSLELQLVLREEMQRADAPLPGTFYCALHHASDAIREYGSEVQKKRHLPRILAAEEIWCQAFSEPNAGSDLANIQTSARREDDHYVLNGQKTWSSGAMRADRAILPARTDPEAPKRRGISYFLVDLRTPGVDVRPIRQMSGEAHFAEIFLDDVMVPVGDRLGEENQGWSIIRSTLNTERGLGFLGFAAATREQIGDLIDRANERGLLSSADGQWSDLRQVLAVQYAEAEILHELCEQLLRELRETGQVGTVASLLKLFQSELGHRVTRTAVRVGGLKGLLAGQEVGLQRSAGSAGVPSDWFQQHLASWVTLIGAGTSEIQRNSISEGVLGLPREPRVPGA